MMREQRGSQFDPLVFDVLEGIVRDKEDESHADTDTVGDEVSGDEFRARQLACARPRPLEGQRPGFRSDNCGARAVPRSTGSREGGDAA